MTAEQTRKAALAKSLEAQRAAKEENDLAIPTCRACEIYGPDQHPCCGEVDGMNCLFEVEDIRITKGGKQ